MAFWKPSRPKPPASGDVAQASVAPPVQNTAAKQAPRKTDMQLQDEAANPRNKGFDPYNSGAFNAKDTWSRVDRKK